MGLPLSAVAEPVDMHREPLKTLPGVTRVRDITWQVFRDDFLSPGVPVVVEDGARTWPALERWTLESFRELFGELQVALQGEFFFGTREMRFADYLVLAGQLAQRTRADWSGSEQAPYLRYGDFSLLAHEKLKQDWSLPYFLPPSGYVWPWTSGPAQPNRRIFPEFGVYVSPRGAFTRFHVDGMRDNAVLCQVQGQKQGFLFAPQDIGDWTRLHPYCDLSVSRIPLALDWIFDGRMPDYGALKPHFFELNQGECLLIPKGWAHEVFTHRTSISVTFNFVHRSDCSREWLGFFLKEAGRRMGHRLAAGVMERLWRRPVKAPD